MSEFCPMEKDILRIAARYLKEYHFYYGDSIPFKKINNARQAMQLAPDEKVYILIDNSILGNAKKGMVICDNGIYWKNMFATKTVKNHLEWKEFSKAQIEARGKETIQFEEGALYLCSGALGQDQILDLLSRLQTLSRGLVHPSQKKPG
jgi:hypothetical protein